MTDPVVVGAAAGARAHWAGIVDAAHDAIAGKLDERKQAHLARVLDRFETELAPFLASFHAEHATDPALPDEVRGLLDTITNPEHFTESLLLGIAVGATVYPIIGAMTAPTAQLVASEIWSKQPTIPLTPTELATAVLKGVLTEPEAADGALKSGLNGTRFGQLVEIAGQSIGIAEALLLWRRGEISHDQLEDVKRYSNLNPKFYGMVDDLRYTPPGTASVLAGVVQGHLDTARATTLYKEAGGNPDNFTWQYETSGRPPGAEQMLHLLNRGLMSDADVRAGIRESDIKNKYIDAIIDSRVYLPPPRSVVPQLRHKSISEATARKFLTDYGVTPDAQDAFIAEASSTRTTAERHATAMQMIAAYEEHLIDRPTAVARIEALNYDAADATMLLDLADAKQADRAIASALTRIHALYVGYRASRADTVTSLASLNIPNADQAQLLAVWGHERAANAPDLTVAQWQGALRRKVISDDRFTAAMTARGYNDFQITVLAAEAFPPPSVSGGATVKTLTPAQDLRLYSAGEITRAETVARLVALGYSHAQADELIALAASPPAIP